jgi:N-hydroxyarylamine O-acetyltransferase
MAAFRLEEADGLYWLSAKQPASWRTMYAFNLEPQYASDYELANWFTSTNPQAPFLNFLIVERLDADRRHKLVNNRYIVEGREGELLSETELASANDLGRILEEAFNISPPAPVEAIYAKIATPPARG